MSFEYHHDAAIYLVANKRSERDCANLVHSIRRSGCNLTIILIPFGGNCLDHPYVLSQAIIMAPEDFPQEAKEFINSIRPAVRNCPIGFLYRFLAFFGPYDRFIYSDNDIVALRDWSYLTDQLDSYDLVHADCEYTTAGRYNFRMPPVCQDAFGPLALEQAITAGHFAARKNSLILSSLFKAAGWIQDHSSACILHDQTLLHVASLIGDWRCLNLCKPPHHWLSSWSGDYANTLDLILKLSNGSRISHLHYSGGPTGNFTSPIDELLLSSQGLNSRLHIQMRAGLLQLLGFNRAKRIMDNIRRRLS